MNLFVVVAFILDLKGKPRVQQFFVLFILEVCLLIFLLVFACVNINIFVARVAPQTTNSLQYNLISRVCKIYKSK